MTCICVLTAFRLSFPHLETLKKILENSTLSRYVKKKKKIPTDRPNFQILVGWGQHNNFFLALLNSLLVNSQFKVFQLIVLISIQDKYLS